MTIWGDIKSKRLIVIKGILFLVLGIMAFVAIWLETRDYLVLFLLSICIWACCRFYYFMFYVIEKYVNPDFKYAGILDFVKRALKNNWHS